MKKIGLIMLVGMALFVISCEEISDPLECATDIPCTEQFVSLTYAPFDAQNNALLFDSFYSQNLDNGNIYDFGNISDFRQDGVYVIITDAQLEEVKSEGTTVRFIAELNGEIVHEQDIVVGHDCCHVLLISGPGA